MEQIPTLISVAALVVAFIAVALARRPNEPSKEKKIKKKRQPREEVQQA
jgi:hypothetical protein